MSEPFKFAKPSEYAGGAFFLPKNHTSDLALLIEPKRIDRDVPNTYNGVTKNRDEVTCDITVFSNSEALDKGEPTASLKNVRVAYGMLTSALEKIIGGAMVGVVRMIPTKSGNGYVFRDVEPADEAAVGRYYQAREAAITAALDDAPPF